MISRRILRIKVLQTIYSFYQGGDLDIAKSEKELLYSIQKSYDLYFFLLLLGCDVCDYARQVINTQKQKLRPTEQDLNPNLKFVNNKFIAQFRENEQFKTRINSTKLSWTNNPELPKRIFNTLKQTDEYVEYMNKETNTYDDDKKIISFMYKTVIYDCDLLYQILEEMSIYWIDTVEFIIGMVLRTIERYKIGYDNSYALPGMYKSDDDRDFVIKLFRTTIAKGDKYKDLISEYTKNWDIERIAFFDILILQTALSEVEMFPEIPLKVTFNEYIELAKNYSTTKSSTFVNGVLDKIVTELISTGKIKKIAEMPNNINTNEE
ncbi:MAG: transcription antitermination factor NusB [Bacteroidales bacterium]|nr:transcription antitermination factor NusB [Bacteroidales bacterium]